VPSEFTKLLRDVELCLARLSDEHAEMIQLVGLYDFSNEEIGAMLHRSLTWVKVGAYPFAVAVNPSSNMVYVANSGDATVSVIDGTNDKDSVTSVAVGGPPDALAVIAATNKLYVANLFGSVTVIDGLSNSMIASLPVGNSPDAVAVNPASNTIYVANQGSSTVSVIAGAGAGAGGGASAGPPAIHSCHALPPGRHTAGVRRLWSHPGPRNPEFCGAGESGCVPEHSPIRGCLLAEHSGCAPRPVGLSDRVAGR
jgi:YVTN family beta-propeller protein